MIQLLIVQTGKGYSPKAKWQTLHEETCNFLNTIKAKEYLKERYGTCRRKKMFVDRNGEAVHVGYVYGFRADDWSHSGREKWIQNDWVEFREVKTISPTEKLLA